MVNKNIDKNNSAPEANKKSLWGKVKDIGKKSGQKLLNILSDSGDSPEIKSEKETKTDKVLTTGELVDKLTSQIAHEKYHHLEHREGGHFLFDKEKLLKLIEDDMSEEEFNKKLQDFLDSSYQLEIQTSNYRNNDVFMSNAHRNFEDQEDFTHAMITYIIDTAIDPYKLKYQEGKRADFSLYVDKRLRNEMNALAKLDRSNLTDKQKGLKALINTLKKYRKVK